ncbi:MAG: hypothetical protein KGL44_06535 [Sphingomonadales bacterium]|nr:hypothetical protein [Sphingomonadales bacterium]
MKKLTLGISAAALALAGVAGLAFADDMPGRGMGGDKTVTRAEAQAHAAQMFDRMDVNKDGKIDAADRDARRAAVFDKLDTNKDGSLSRAEFNAAHPGMEHGEGGPDGDHAGMGHDGPPPPGAGGMGGMAMGGEGMEGHHRMGGHGMRGHRMGGGEGGMGMMMLGMADTNKDGAVTRDEFNAAFAKHFDLVDTNHDGQITPAERQAFHQSMRQRMTAPAATPAPK